MTRPTTCLECHGEGTIITCCNDLCHAVGFCIHGDGEIDPLDWEAAQNELVEILNAGFFRHVESAPFTISN